MEPHGRQPSTESAGLQDPAPTDPDATASRLGGRYELRSVLGRGGMATVWRALLHGESGFRRDVAIKQLLPGLGSEELAMMFVEEARVVSALQHPNVVQVFDFGRDDEGRYFIVMELVEGLDLGAIRSVASVFVSRFDTMIDPLLGDGSDAASLRSGAGLANARLVYEIHRQSLETERARMLLDAGANPQRPLWASTGTKDPTLPDTLYVSELMLPGTVNTMPEATLTAFADHGLLPDFAHTEEELAAAFREADALLNALDAQGVDYNEITARLEAEGLQKFEASWNDLLATVGTALQEAR